MKAAGASAGVAPSPISKSSKGPQPLTRPKDELRSPPRNAGSSGAITLPTLTEDLLAARDAVLDDRLALLDSRLSNADAASTARLANIESRMGAADKQQSDMMQQLVALATQQATQNEVLAKLATNMETTKKQDSHFKLMKSWAHTQGVAASSGSAAGGADKLPHKVPRHEGDQDTSGVHHAPSAEDVSPTSVAASSHSLSQPAAAPRQRPTRTRKLLRGPPSDRAIANQDFRCF